MQKSNMYKNVPNHQMSFLCFLASKKVSSVFLLCDVVQLYEYCRNGLVANANHKTPWAMHTIS